MSLINWIQYTEPVVGRNSPTFIDVVNRPLRTILTDSGLNPDLNFPGFVVQGNPATFPSLLVTGLASFSSNVNIAGALSTGLLSTLNGINCTSIAIFSNGITVSTGGINVTGNSTITGTLHVTSNFVVDLLATISTISPNSIVATNAISQLITASTTGTGAVVLALNPIFTGGITVTSGLTVLNGGASIVGNSTINGTLNVTSDFTVNTSKFIVSSANGNTTIAGTLGVTGLATFNNQITSTLGSITTDIKNFSGTATWNNVATTFNGIFLNVTNTASSATSNLLKLQVSGVDRFTIDRRGVATFRPDDSAGGGGNSAYIYIDYWTGGGEAGGGILIGNFSTNGLTANTYIANSIGITNAITAAIYYNGTQWYEGWSIFNIAGGGGTRSTLALMKGGGTVTIGSSASTLLDLRNASTIKIGSLTASQVVMTDATKVLISVATTGTGNIVRSDSPTLTGVIIGAALTLSGLLTITREQAIIFSPLIGTNAAYQTYTNAGGSYNIGVDNSTGSLSGTAYALTMFAPATRPVVIGTGGAVAFTINAVQEATFAGALVTVGLNTTSNPIFTINGVTSTERVIRFATAGSRRWAFITTATAESGSNAGSDFAIASYDDTATIIDIPITIVRATGGTITLTRPVAITNPTLTISGGVNPNLTLNDGTTSASFDLTGGTPRIYANTGKGIILAVNNNGSTITIASTGGIQVGAPTGGDKGVGTINVASDIYKNNTAYTNPDYVLEYWMTGKLVKYAENARIANVPNYKLLSLTDARSYAESNLRLPGINNDAIGIFSRSELLLEKIEEQFTYICELEDRILQLEKR